MKPETVEEHLQAFGERVVRGVDQYLMSHKIDNEIIGLHWKMDYKDVVSNTHAAPHNGKTNWGGRHKDLPRGYPGFEGRVWIRYRNEMSISGSDPLRACLLYTGTGGFGTYEGPWAKLASELNKFVMDNMDTPTPTRKKDLPFCYSWDARFFMADLDPEIAEQMEQDYFLRILKTDTGKSIEKRYSHHFKWDDTMTLAKDHQRLNPFSVSYGL